MKLQTISRELIKSSTPTPSSLENYKISLVDEIAPTMNVPLILYYLAAKSISACNHLKNSLAETLTRFYPLAGRYMKDSYSVDCSDQGAEFVQAQVDIRLNDLLGQGVNLKVELHNNFLPIPLGAADEITDPLFAIQVNVFDYGGLAIGVCFPHRVADMSTISTFVKESANVTASWGDWALTRSLPTLTRRCSSQEKIYLGLILEFQGPRKISKFIRSPQKCFASIRRPFQASKARPQGCNRCLESYGRLLFIRPCIRLGQHLITNNLSITNRSAE